MNQKWTTATGTSLAVAHEVLRKGPLSRAELARHFGVTAGTMTRIVKPLLDEGVLIEKPADNGDSAEQRLGRPSQPIDVALHDHEFLGVKITADRLYAVAINLRAEVKATAETDLTDLTPTAVATKVGNAIAELTSTTGGGDSVHTQHIGVSIGGDVAGSGRIRRAPFIGWTDIDFGSMLAKELQVPPVLVNDLVGITESTHWFGEGRRTNSFALVTIGAGVGLGLVVHGQMVTSPDSGLGLIGHYPLVPSGPPCPEGHRGCAYSVLASPSIAKAISAAHGKQLTYDQALDLAAQGDTRSMIVIDDAARALGKLIAAVANIATPELVVIGGEGYRLAEVGHAAMMEGISADRDPLAGAVPIQLQRQGFLEWARGAAVMAIQDFISAH